jgi:hypothetical protein
MMFLKGNFETFFLAGVLQILYNDAKTGILRVLNDNTEVRIVFKEGDIIYSVGSYSDARLSKSFENKRILSGKTLKECFHIAKKKRVSLDQILLDKNLMTVDTLCKVIHNHVEDIIVTLLLWETGEFEYKDTDIHNFEDIFTTKVNTIHVLLGASRRINQLSVLRKQISNDTIAFRPNEKVSANVEIVLNLQEQQILSIIDGTKTVRQIVQKTGHNELDVYKCLYSLISVGLIIKTTDADRTKDIPPKTTIKNHIALYSSIITIYLDIIHIMCRSLEIELGCNVFSIIDECKPESSVFKPIFKNFNPQNPHDSNIHVILQAIEYTDSFEKGRMVLINGFNEFFRLILNRISDILGPKQAMEMIGKIEETLAYVDKYQNNDIGKRFLISEIRSMLLKTQNRILYKKETKKTGLHSLFNKNKAV